MALFNTVDAWSTSDVGRFSQTVLFAVFPELLIVKTIATPVLRQLIRTVSVAKQLWKAIFQFPFQMFLLYNPIFYALFLAISQNCIILHATVGFHIHLFL